MIRLLDLLLHLFSRILRSRCDLLLENLALRQQVGVLRRNCPRPRLTGPDKFFWVVLRRSPDVIPPRIHGELKMLGFDISERSVSRWLRRAPQNPEPSKRWMTFLNNHREAIAAMDFFIVPTLTFNVLYCFFVIAHDRRRIVHFNRSEEHTSELQSLRHLV